MVCVYCGSPTEVTNSRLQRRGNHIWRRRKCKNCGSLFTTREYAAFDEVFVINAGDRKLERFNRDKLFLAIYESCKHRPTALKDATALTETIVDQLTRAHREGTIAREAIAHHTHVALSRFDPIAATFFAAYHATH